MALIDPLFEFGFDVLNPGYQQLEVKETGIEAQKSGKASGKRYWVRLVAIGGGQDGVSHLESFFEKTKEDFSFRKLAGFLYKLGVIKLGKVDTDHFLTTDFETKWLKGINGKRMGGKFRHKFADDDKTKSTPRSDMEKYLTFDEAGTLRDKGPVVPNSVPAAGAEKVAAAPTATKEPAPWD